MSLTNIAELVSGTGTYVYTWLPAKANGRQLKPIEYWLEKDLDKIAKGEAIDSHHSRNYLAKFEKQHERDFGFEDFTKIDLNLDSLKAFRAANQVFEAIHQIAMMARSGFLVVQERNYQLYFYDLRNFYEARQKKIEPDELVKQYLHQHAAKEGNQPMRLRGNYQGKEIAIPVSWSTHTFSVEELEKLLNGASIPVDYVDKHGKQRSTTVRLGLSYDKWQIKPDFTN